MGGCGGGLGSHGHAFFFLNSFISIHNSIAFRMKLTYLKCRNPELLAKLNNSCEDLSPSCLHNSLGCWPPTWRLVVRRQLVLVQPHLRREGGVSFHADALCIREKHPSQNPFFL